MKCYLHGGYVISMNSSTKSFTTDHYIGLLLVHAAHVDLEYTEVEKQYILSKVGEETLFEVERYYQNTTDYVVLDYLISNRSRFMPGDEGRKETLELLKELFEVDGDYSVLEVNSFEFLGRLFTIED